MLKKLLFNLFPIILIITAGCGVRSDQEILNEIRYKMNNDDFSGAISLFDQIKSNSEDIVSLKAEAYAGLGGLKFFSIMDNFLKNDSLAPIELIYNLSSISSDGMISSLITANSLIENNLNKVTRSGKTDLKYSFFEFFYSSLLLRKYFNSVNSLTFDPCNESQFPSSAVKELIISINKGADAINVAIQKENLSKLSTVASDVSKITFLSETNAYKFFVSDVTPQDVAGFRSLIKSNLVTRGLFCP